MQKVSGLVFSALVLAALVLSAALSAATGQDGPGEPEGQPPTAVFEGVPWRLDSFHSGDELKPAIKGDRPATFRFEGGRVAGSAGCNQLSGGYRLDGEALSFEPNMTSTMMACPEPLMEQERLTTAAFATVASHRQTGEFLDMLNSDSDVIIRFAVIETTPLVGTRWRLTVYNNGRQALVSTLAGTEITLELREDGTLGGSGGCNRYMSGYVIDGDKLTIGPIATSRKACGRPEGVNEQAAGFAAALGTVTDWRIEGKELTLTDADGKTAARWSTAENGPTPDANDGARERTSDK